METKLKVIELMIQCGAEVSFSLEGVNINTDIPEFDTLHFEILLEKYGIDTTEIKDELWGTCN